MAPPQSKEGTADARGAGEAKRKVEELEENPPEKLEDWPKDEAMYETFGGPEGDPIPGGPTDTGDGDED